MEVPHQRGLEEMRKKKVNCGQSGVNLSMLALPAQESSWCRVGSIAYLAVGGLLASYLPN